MIKFYGYKRCGTSRKAEKFLSDANIEYKFFDLTIHPPAKTTLKKMIKQSQEPIKKFFNTSGVEYRKLNMKEKIKELKDTELIELLSQNGKLIKRPIITDGNNTTVGFNEDKLSIWIK